MTDAVTEAIRALDPCEACWSLPEYLQHHVPLDPVARVERLAELVRPIEATSP